ncbi:proton myo-inositol cotransporter-like [Ornithodoros turicata]|uniref:Putative proton myo-inositol cotransporter n=1 Tax=Ornithodoros turicata TaxID=34597 RepID=A0A2R5L9H5_9ACAR
MKSDMNDFTDERQSIIGNDVTAASRTPVTRYLVCATLLSAVGGFLFGYDTGVVSGAMIQLKNYFQLTPVWQELVVSVTIAGAWAFAIVAGTATDAMGRKPVVLVASLVFAVGAVLMGVAVNKGMLLGGRLIVGAGIGLASMTVPVYIAEVAPADLRGFLVSINQVFLTGGLFIASVVDGAFSTNEDNGWRYMLGLAGVPAIIQFVAFLGMPESPRWLASKGNYQEAMVVLRKFRGATADIEQEFEAMKASSLDHQNEEGSTVLMQVLRNRSLRLALIVGCTLMVVQQVAGINTVMYYGATIIQMSGVHEESEAIWLSAATTFVNFACSFIAMALVERLGRRMLLLLSLIGVIISLAVLASGFQLADMHSPRAIPSGQPGSCSNYSTCAQCVNSPLCGFCSSDSSGMCLQVDPKNMQHSSVGPCSNHSSTAVWGYDWCPSKQWWMTILGLVMYLFFFAPGLGAMPWTINSEIYPLWARSTCFSIATSVCWAFNLLVSMTFLTLTEALTKYGTFWLYGGLSTVGLLFFFLFLPETKGKSLDELEDLFAHPWWSDSTIHPNKKTVQYVHIRGINHAYTTDEADSGEETS